MGQQIIRQPNGLYAIWSSVVDHFILYDCTPEGIIEERCKEECARIEKGVRETVAQLEAGEKPYYQFTKTWEEAIAWAEEVHGSDDETLALLREAGLIK